MVLYLRIRRKHEKRLARDQRFYKDEQVRRRLRFLQSSRDREGNKPRNKENGRIVRLSRCGYEDVRRSRFRYFLGQGRTFGKGARGRRDARFQSRRGDRGMRQQDIDRDKAQRQGRYAAYRIRAENVRRGRVQRTLFYRNRGGETRTAYGHKGGIRFFRLGSIPCPYARRGELDSR